MDPEALRVLADDLTGACDVGAALLPSWPGGVFVEAFAAGARPAASGLWVCNTQSRLLPETAARAAVARALEETPPGAIILKKIDTALRGHLGAELAAAMTAAGAAEAFVLPAIPAVGRTTVGGVQYIDGRPVHETAFAADPLHPIRDSDVTRHVALGSGMACRSLGLDEVRRPARLAAAIEAARADGYATFVCDAVTDSDLDLAVGVLLERPRPCVLAGSLGLGAALRRRLGAPGARPERRPAPRAGGAVLVVVGSGHPAARAQSAACGLPVVTAADPAAGASAGERAAAHLAAGGGAVVAAPAEVAPGAAERVLEAVARAARVCVERARPAGLVVVGGETAEAVLRACQQPWLRVVGTLEPLVVASELVGGALDGTPVVTKGGSSGDAGTIVRALAWIQRGA